MKISSAFDTLPARRDQPAGILVLDGRPEPADPRLRAFIWCPRHANRTPPPTQRRGRFRLLMVGLARNGDG